MAILSRSGGGYAIFVIFFIVSYSPLSRTSSHPQTSITHHTSHITHHLNRYFIDFVLKKEQEVYAQEELDIPHVLPRDNEDVLKLLDGRPLGLLPRLDEEVCLRPSQV